MTTRRMALSGLLGAATLTMPMSRAWGGPLERSKAGKPDVLIIGAGLSGLYAAMLLEDAGLSVQVLEGSNRVGGRCLTARALPGRPEMGASQVGAMYARVRYLCERLGLKLVLPPAGALAETRLPGTAISLHGNQVIRTQWANAPENRLAPDERKLLPIQLWSHFSSTANPMRAPADWRNPEMLAFDRMSIGAWLRQTGASDEACRLIGSDIDSGTLEDGSALDMLRKAAYYRWEAQQGAYHLIANGTDALPSAMAASLRTPVRLDTPVTAISDRADRVEVRCADGRQFSAPRVLVTLPFSVLRRIAIDAPLAPGQAKAIKDLPYNEIFRVMMVPRRPFWDDDGLPATTWTDGPLERIFVTPNAATPHGQADVYVNGAASAQLRRLSRPQLQRFVLDEFARIRPSTRGQLDIIHVENWADNPFQRGAYAFFRPGQISRFGDVMARPAGRLYFAGEHTGQLHAGMEAACESGERAATELLDLA